jgi:hypothetical protein
MKQTTSRPRRLAAAPRTLLSVARGGAESTRCPPGKDMERTPYDTANTAVAPYSAVTVDVPYGGKLTVGPDGKTTWTPA